MAANEEPAALQVIYTPVDGPAALTAAGNEFLCSLDDQPVAAIAVVGPAGLGKSALCNMLVLALGASVDAVRERGFQVSGEARGREGVTKGVWAWSQPLAHPVARRMRVLVFDVEGSGLGSSPAAERVNAVLMSVMSVLSSVIVFRTDILGNAGFDSLTSAVAVARAAVAEPGARGYFTNARLALQLRDIDAAWYAQARRNHPEYRALDDSALRQRVVRDWLQSSQARKPQAYADLTTSFPLETVALCATHTPDDADVVPFGDHGPDFADSARTMLDELISLLVDRPVNVGGVELSGPLLASALETALTNMAGSMVLNSIAMQTQLQAAIRRTLVRAGMRAFDEARGVLAARGANEAVIFAARDRLVEAATRACTALAAQLQVPELAADALATIRQQCTDSLSGAEAVTFAARVRASRCGLVVYRPQRRTLWTLARSGGDADFAVLSRSHHGIGACDLVMKQDRLVAFDFGPPPARRNALVAFRPGSGTAFTFVSDGRGAFVPQPGAAFRGLRSCDLFNVSDRVVPFDFASANRDDHLLVYRPGYGRVEVAALRADGTFESVFASVSGFGPVGSLTMRSAADRVCALDLGATGSCEFLLVYRPGSGAAALLRSNGAGGMDTVMETCAGIGLCSLSHPATRAIALDASGSGHADHVLFITPGAGEIVVTAWDDSARSFVTVFYSRVGICGGFGLMPMDRAVAFDCAGSGSADHLLLTRNGVGQVAIARWEPADRAFVRVHASQGLAGFDFLSKTDRAVPYYV